MSYWTYVTGVIQISVLGYTQKQKEYIIDMVLRHLPKVTGSERDMDIHSIKCSGYNESSSVDEFDVHVYNYLHYVDLQSQYLLVVEGALRDRTFEQTYREFVRWLTRLAKRVVVDDVLVKIFDPYNNNSIITNNNDAFGQMYEWGSWMNDTGVPTWTEFMLWDTDGLDNYPLTLLAREGDEDAIQELVRRRQWRENIQKNTNKTEI